jgi:hypothetical protein
MEMAYRRIMLRVAYCYRTTSTDAAAVSSSMSPFTLMAEERTKQYAGTEKKITRDQTISSWQRKWTAFQKERWTFRFISDIAPWFGKHGKHEEVTFYLCQVLTGHECFNQYLQKYGI